MLEGRSPIQTVEHHRIEQDDNIELAKDAGTIATLAQYQGLEGARKLKDILTEKLGSKAAYDDFIAEVEAELPEPSK